MLRKFSILKLEFRISGVFWFHLWREQGSSNLKCSFLRKRLKDWTASGPEPGHNWSNDPDIGSKMINGQFFNLYETSKFSRRKRHLNFDANDKINVKINSRYRYWFQKRLIHRSHVQKCTVFVKPTESFAYEIILYELFVPDDFKLESVMVRSCVF